MIYKLIGRIVVGALRLRYGREIRIAAGAGVALTALGIAAYLATRGENEEAPVRTRGAGAGVCAPSRGLAAGRPRSSGGCARGRRGRDGGRGDEPEVGEPPRPLPGSRLVLIPIVPAHGARPLIGAPRMPPGSHGELPAQPVEYPASAAAAQLTRPFGEQRADLRRWAGRVRDGASGRQRECAATRRPSTIPPSNGAGVGRRPVP